MKAKYRGRRNSAYPRRKPNRPGPARWPGYHKTREQERESYNAKVMERGWGELR